MKNGDCVRFQWGKSASGIIEKIDGYQIKIKSCWDESVFYTDISGLVVCQPPDQRETEQKQNALQSQR